jgi:hypothetical protein
MKCPNCKTDNPAGERFCWRCHLPLEEGGQKWAGHAAIVKGRQRILKLLVLAAVAAALAFAAVQIAYRRSPAAAVEAFTKARERGDFRTMFLLLSRDSQRELKRQGVRDIWPAQRDIRYKFGVLDWAGRGNAAAVRVLVEKESTVSGKPAGGESAREQQVVKLIKEDGKWRLDYTSAGAAGS